MRALKAKKRRWQPHETLIYIYWCWESAEFKYWLIIRNNWIDIKWSIINYNNKMEKSSCANFPYLPPSQRNASFWVFWLRATFVNDNGFVTAQRPCLIMKVAAVRCFRMQQRLAFFRQPDSWKGQEMKSRGKKKQRGRKEDGERSWNLLSLPPPPCWYFLLTCLRPIPAIWHLARAIPHLFERLFLIS